MRGQFFSRGSLIQSGAGRRNPSNLPAGALALPTIATARSFVWFALRRRNSGSGKVDRLLRPALQCGASGIGQYVHAPLGAIEPAIDIVQQDLARVGPSDSAHAQASACWR